MMNRLIKIKNKWGTKMHEGPACENSAVIPAVSGVKKEVNSLGTERRFIFNNDISVDRSTPGSWVKRPILMVTEIKQFYMWGLKFQRETILTLNSQTTAMLMSGINNQITTNESVPVENSSESTGNLMGVVGEDNVSQHSVKFCNLTKKKKNKTFGHFGGATSVPTAVPLGKNCLLTSADLYKQQCTKLVNLLNKGTVYTESRKYSPDETETEYEKDISYTSFCAVSMQQGLPVIEKHRWYISPNVFVDFLFHMKDERRHYYDCAFLEIEDSGYNNFNDDVFSGINSFKILFPGIQVVDITNFGMFSMAMLAKIQHQICKINTLPRLKSSIAQRRKNFFNSCIENVLEERNEKAEKNMDHLNDVLSY